MNTPCRARGRFARELLPSPSFYFRAQGLKLAERNGWQSTRCVFHADARPSLRIHIETGAFCCLGCGQRGGDIIAFHVARYGLSFAEACKELGCWETER